MRLRGATQLGSIQPRWHGAHEAVVAQKGSDGSGGYLRMCKHVLVESRLHIKMGPLQSAGHGAAYVDGSSLAYYLSCQEGRIEWDVGGVPSV